MTADKEPLYSPCTLEPGEKCTVYLFPKAYTQAVVLEALQIADLSCVLCTEWGGGVAESVS